MEELYKEKESLCKKIKELEKLAKHPEDSIFPYYYNDTNLSVYKMYLAELEKLINKLGDE